MGCRKKFATNDFTEKTAEAQRSQRFTRKNPINPRNPRLFSVDSRINANLHKLQKLVKISVNSLQKLII